MGGSTDLHHPIAHGDRSLRELLPVLDEDELQLAFGAVGLAGWHAAAGFCPACGTVTTVVHAGHARRCPGCGREDYPRTDPAVIVAITDSEARLLLGRQPSWPSTRYSVLAGFVETGESLNRRCAAKSAKKSASASARWTIWARSRGRFPDH